MEYYHDLKQVCFSLETDLEFKQNDLYEAIRQFIPVGSNVHVKRGNRIWRNIRVIAIHNRSHVGYFSGETVNGKVHNFYYRDVVL